MEQHGVTSLQQKLSASLPQLRQAHGCNASGTLAQSAQPGTHANTEPRCCSSSCTLKSQDSRFMASERSGSGPRVPDSINAVVAVIYSSAVSASRTGGANFAISGS